MNKKASEKQVKFAKDLYVKFEAKCRMNYEFFQNTERKSYDNIWFVKNTMESHISSEEFETNGYLTKETASLVIGMMLDYLKK